MLSTKMLSTKMLSTKLKLHGKSRHPGRGRPKVHDRALKSKLGVLRVSVVKFEVYGYISLAETQDH